MRYEISNVVFNHKLSEWEISHRNPFAKTLGKGQNKIHQNFYLVKDDPEALFKVYQQGHCIKPHAFDANGDMFVNTIILDFDNLTEVQYKFVEAVVNGSHVFKHGMCGDFSSGMKTRLHANQGIAGWKPTTWKYKVFYPVENCLCTYEDVDAKFMEAVAFFNPMRSMEDVKKVWRLWRKANNRKDKIADSIFNDWILPDVAMANNFRSQITYAVDVSQVDRMRTASDVWMYKHLPVEGMAKYPSTTKWDYKELDWKLEVSKPVLPKVVVEQKHVLDCENIIRKNLSIQQDSFHLPISKADFSRRLKKNHFDDLVVGSASLTLLLSKMFKKRHAEIDLAIKIDDMMKDATLAGKCFSRIAAELRLQGVSRSMKEEALQDAIRAFKEIHGQKVFQTLKQRDRDKVIHELARSFMSTWLNYKAWRMSQRLMSTNVSPSVYEARNKWRDSHDDADRNNFFIVRNADIQARWKQAKSSIYNSPYDFHRKGFKAEVFDILIDGEVKIESLAEFVEWIRTKMVSMKDGEFSDKFLATWFVQYKTEWNKTHPDNKIARKKVVSRKSKYDEIFSSMSKDDIASWIKESDLKPNMKSNLRKKYL